VADISKIGLNWNADLVQSFPYGAYQDPEVLPH